MTKPTPNHIFDPLTLRCQFCGKSQSEIEDEIGRKRARLADERLAPDPRECPQGF